MSHSTGYRGISRGFRPFIYPGRPALVRTRPPSVLLTRAVLCDQCGALVPAGARGRYYAYRDGVKFYGETCHAKMSRGRE